MKSNYLKILVLLLLVVICGISLFFYLFITAHDYAVPLGNGYRYFGAKEGLTVIDRGCMSEAERERANEIWNEFDKKNIDYYTDDVGAPYVGPNVACYRVYPRMITGYVSRPKGDSVEITHPDLQAKKRMKQGYFLIDTHTNRIYRGLSKQEWMVYLKRYGLNHEPKLIKPSGNRN